MQAMCPKCLIVAPSVPDGGSKHPSQREGATPEQGVQNVQNVQNPEVDPQMDADIKTGGVFKQASFAETGS